jgi:hypothetical protein
LRGGPSCPGALAGVSTPSAGVSERETERVDLSEALLTADPHGVSVIRLRIGRFAIATEIVARGLRDD